MFAVYQLELFQVFDTFKPGFFKFSQVVFIIQTFQDLFVANLCCSIFLFEVMQDIPHTDTVTAYFIRISRTDTFSGSSYLSITFGSFIGSIQYTVRRQNEVRFLRNVQSLLQVVSRCFQRFCFRFEQSRIEHYTVTDDIYFISLENTRRDRAKHVLLSFELKCMTGIRSTLETCNYIISRS